jgi:hypothetical protein
MDIFLYIIFLTIRSIDKFRYLASGFKLADHIVVEYTCYTILLIQAVDDLTVVVYIAHSRRYKS